MRNWIDPDTESSLLDEVAQRRQRLSALRASIVPQTGQLASSYADAYPWMDPTAVQSLVQAGVSPDLPQVQAAADLAAQEAAETGEFDDSADDVPDAWYETLWGVTTGWAKPFVRTGFTALSAPREELEALLTAAGHALFDETEAGKAGLLSDPLGNIAAVAGEALSPAQLVSDFWTNYTEKASRSMGVLALADLVQGKHVDLGEGFLPGGEIFAERERAKQRLQLDGHFLTPGRLIARQFSEPGTTQYQILSGLNDFVQEIVADPVIVPIAGLSKAAQANRSFQTIGAVWGTRKTVAPERAVNHYLNSELGQKTIRWLTQNDDVETAWRAIGQADLGTAKRLAGSKTDAETFSVLSDVLGTVVREKPTAGFVSRSIGGIGGNDYGKLFGAGARARKAGANVRLGVDMPRSILNPDDINDAAVQLDRWMRNAGIPDDARKARIAELSTLDNGDNIGLFATARRVMDDTEGLLVKEWGVVESRAKQLTQMYENLADELHTFGVDALGRHEDVMGPFRINVNGVLETTPRAMPLLSSEMANIIPLPPTVREIRRLTPQVERMQRLFDSGLWKGSVDSLDSFMSGIWKPLQLLRGAYTVRVIGEEQIRMAGAGYDSLISHPASAIAWNLSIEPKSRFAQKLARAAEKVIDPKGTATVTGDLWDDVAEHAAAMSRGAAGHTGLPGETITGRYVKARQGDPDFYRGWTVELSHVSNDPVMRRLAGGLREGDVRSIGGKTTGNTLDDVKEWFWSGTGQKFRKDWSRIEGRGALATDRRVADEYIDIFARRLERSTGGDTELIEAVAKGKLGDDTLRGFDSERRIARTLEENHAGAAPEFTKKPETIRTRGRNQPLDRVVEMGFDFLMSKPTNWLSRSPTFRQKYWERVEEVIGFADRPTQEAIVRAAREANIGGAAEARMATKILQGEGSKLAGLDDVDMLAKGFALDETRRLLYDLQKRSQFFDQMRLMFPFGEAWKEIIGAWTQILRKNPQVFRRFQQGLDGARSPSVLPGAEPETEPGTGQGFFHPDPQTGEEVFSYPAAWVGKLLGVSDSEGVGLEFVGRAAGLNIVTATVLPGFGPVVQWPASRLIPHKPEFDTLRDIILPFGAPEGSFVEQLVDTVTPAWMEKVITGLSADPESNRLFANTVADVQRALVRQGEYDISTVEGQQQLADDALAKAQVLYLIRGVAQSTVPTGPSFQWNTTDVEGNVVSVKMLSDELRRMTDEEYGGDRQAAFTEWVRRFGVENVLAVVGKSTALVERPVTEKGDDWLRAHQDLERTYPITVGFFAPEPAVGEFDYNAYLRQFATGARQAVSPSEQVALANDFLGRIQWEQAKKVAAFRPGPQTATWLAKVREDLAERHPGFDGWVARRIWEQRPKTDEMIAELRRAVTEPALAATDAGKGTIKYLSAIDMANQMVAMLPGNVRRYQQAKSTRHIRDWLRIVARNIIEEHPDFARTWSQVFERELADDDELLTS